MLFVIHYLNKNVKESNLKKMDNIVIGMKINVKDKSLHHVKMLII